MTGQAPQTLAELNNTPLPRLPGMAIPSGDPNTLADLGTLSLAQQVAQLPIQQEPQPATLRQLREASLVSSFREAAKADPRVAGEAQRIGLELDPTRNPVELERQLPQMREILAQRYAEDRLAAVQSPTLRRQLSDPHFARIAHDQTEALGFFESLGKNYRAGQLTIEQGALGNVFRRGVATDSDARRLQEIEKDLAALPSRSGGPLDGLFRYVGQFSVTLPEAIKVGGVAAAGAMVAGQLGPQVGIPEEVISVPTAFSAGVLTETFMSSYRSESGSMYLDMVRQGFDKNTAANAAGVFGTLSGALEVVGFGVMAAPAKKALLGEVKRKVSDLLVKPTMGAALKSAGKGYAAGFLGEVGTETLQTINEILARELARPAGQKRATFDEITSELADTIVETAKGMSLLAGAGPGLKLAVDRKAVQRAQEQQQVIAQFVAQAAGSASEWKARNPAAFEKSLGEIAKESGTETFYVDARTLGEILRQQDKAQTDAGQGLTKSTANQLDEVLPGFSEQLAEAERTGDDVQIPSATFAARLGDTPLAKQLAPHLRLDPESMSAAEAEKVAAEADKAPTADAGSDADRAFAESAAKVEETLRADIDKALTDAQANVTKTERAGVSRIASEMVATLAEGTGKTPEQILQDFRPAILGGLVEQQQADTLNQPDQFVNGARKTDTPEFKAWFGDSKFDGSFFHGSGVEFTRFDTSQRMAFFTKDKDVAASYSDQRQGARMTESGRVGPEPIVYEVYLSSQNPLDLTTTDGLRRFTEAMDPSSEGYRQAVTGLQELGGDAAAIEKKAAILRRRVKDDIAYHGGQVSRGYRVPEDQASTDAIWQSTMVDRDSLWANLIVPALKAVGYDGLVIGEDAMTGSNTSYVVFDPTQIKSVNNRGAFNPNDPNILRQPARGQFGRNRLAILFGQKADASTVLHELTHWYVEVLLRMAEAGNAPPAIQQQIDALFARWGVADAQAWSQLSAAEQAKHLEDIAYNAEEYFATGEAPSKELASLFSRIRTWITRIYRAVRDTLNAAYRRETGADLPALTPELRQFFDRMLASQQAIDLAQAERGMASLFLDEKARKAAGITEEQWANVQKMDAEARDQAVADLTAKAVRGMGAFEGARLRVVKEWQQKLAGTRAKVRAEVEAEVAERPVYRAQAQVRYGTVIDENGQEQSAKLDTDAVRRILGDEARLEAYEKQQQEARAAAEAAAVAKAGEIAKGRAGAVASAVRSNDAMLEQERQAASEKAQRDAVEAVRAQPVFQAIEFIRFGEIDDNGTMRSAKLDRGAVRLLAGKTNLGAAAEVFERIPSNLIRKDGASPDVIAAQFGFPNATALIEAIAGADFDKEVAKKAKELRDQSGLFSPQLDTAAGVMAAEDAVASPAAARAAFAEGQRAAREASKKTRPELVSDLLRDYTRKGGVSPDATAEMFGYPNGEAMLREFLTAPAQEDAVNARTDERMEAEHSELSDPKALRRAIESALHSTARAKLIATELRHLLKTTQSTASMIAAAKEAARRKLLTMEVGRISPRQFVQAEARAAKQAREALASGDVQEAIEAQRRYLLQHELTRQALDIEKEVDKFVEAVDERYFADDEKVIKGRNLDIVQAARSILGEHGLASGRRYDKALAYLRVLQQQNPELHAELEGLVADATVDAKDYRSTTLEQFRVMVNAVESLWDRAKRSHEIDVNGQRISKEIVRDELLAAAQKQYGAAKAPSPQTDAARRASRWSTGPALLKRVEHFTQWLDGGADGPWTRYVFRPMRKRFDAYMASREQRIKALRDIIKGLDLPAEKIDAPELGTQTFNSTAELLGAMLHMGNASNLQKLLGGYGWGARLADGTVDVTGWWRMVDRLTKAGRITQQHLDALQAMWDLMEDLKGEAQKVNRALYGTYFEEIEAQPFKVTLPDGTVKNYRGGYAPAKPDPELNADLGIREGLEAIQDAERNFRESMPAAGRGFTKTRNQSTRPLLLDVRLVGTHVDEVLRFVHLQPSLRDVAGLLRDRELSGYLNSVDKTAIKDVLTPWLERTAHNRMSKRGAWPALDNMLNWLRHTTGLATMFGSLTNAAQQVTGLQNAAVYVPWRHLRGAMWDGWTNATAQRVASLSTFMDQRLNSQVGQLQDDIDLALKPSAWGAVKEWTNRNGYFLQRMVQNRVDPIVWVAAFNHSLEQSGATETDAAAVAKAVDHADSVVRKSQGSQTAIDVAAYEAGTPLVRLFTQFSGYFNTVLNQITSQQGATAKAKAAVHALVLPTFVAGVIAAALNGHDDIDDKDGDGYSDEYASWFFAQQLRGASGLVPFFGPNAFKGLASAGLVPGTRNPGNRLQLAPAFSMAEAFFRTLAAAPRLATGTATPGQVRDAFMVLSLSGVPMGTVGRVVTIGR